MNIYFRKNTSLYSPLLIFLLCIYSCTDKINDTLTITPSINELIFSSNGQTALSNGENIDPIFKVDTGNNDWEITITPPNSWCRVEQTKNGFIVTAAHNRSTIPPEEVTLTITSGNAKPITIRLLQKALTRDVYIAGYRQYPNSKFCATYWKNGEPMELQVDTIGSTAEDIYVKDGDVYVVGSETIKSLGGVSVARCWKNGERVWLADNIVSSSASAVVKDGDDLYIAGTLHATLNTPGAAAYWKNGEIIILPSVGNEPNAHSIAVINGDVYVGGNDEVGAVYWKNGQRIEIGEMKSYGMEISDQGIYLVGDCLMENNEHYPMYWHDGEWVHLETTNHGVISDVLLAGEDVYMAGRDSHGLHREACYWKNSVQYWLEGDPNSYAKGIAVAGNDVYVVGSMRTSGSNYKAVYWLNGEVYLLDRNGTTSDIYIVEEEQ